MTRTERQIRLLLRAWPMLDRQERGDEIVGTSLDLIPEGRDWIPMSMALNLIVGGLRARRRGRPPILRWLWYAAGGRLPARWRTWVFHDLTDLGWRGRIVFQKLVTMTIMGAVVAIANPLNWIHSNDAKVNHSTGSPLATIHRCCAFLLVYVFGALRIRRQAPKIRSGQLARHGFYGPIPSGPPGLRHPPPD